MQTMFVKVQSAVRLNEYFRVQVEPVRNEAGEIDREATKNAAIDAWYEDSGDYVGDVTGDSIDWDCGPTHSVVDELPAALAQTPAATGTLEMIAVSPEERNTILAALRTYQAMRDGAPDGIEDIATNGYEHPPLSNNAIDHLCERINLGPAPAPLQEIVGSVISIIDHLDRESESAQSTDTGDVWEVFGELRALLDPYLTAEQRAELERQRIAHEAELAAEEEEDA